MLLHDPPKETRQCVDRLGVNERVSHIHGQGRSRDGSSDPSQLEGWRDLRVAPRVDGETKGTQRSESLEKLEEAIWRDSTHSVEFPTPLFVYEEMFQMGARRCQREEVIVRQIHGECDVDVHPAELVKDHTGSHVI